MYESCVSFFFPANFGQSEQNHQRQRDRAYRDLRKADVRRLKHEEHQRQDEAIEAQSNRLVYRAPGQDNRSAGDPREKSRLEFAERPYYNS